VTENEPDSLDRLIDPLMDPLIDPLIDDVARRMTAAQVDDTFARRVSARLENPDAGAPRIWPRAWLLAPAAVAVLLAAFLFRTNVRLKPDATAVGRPGAAAVRKPDAEGTATATENVATAVRQPETGARVAESATNSARNSGPPGPAADSGVEPLLMPPIEFAALDVSPLVTVMPIEIQTIAIERIEIPPMP
jgi:hypothetical protein